jgi:hypothetical protein
MIRSSACPLRQADPAQSGRHGDRISYTTSRDIIALLEEIIPARYIHEIDLLFNFAGGPSVRNQIAHGKVPAGGHWDHNFVYAAWLIIHLAILPIARRWGNVEEIFARTTGLHRPATD